MEVENCVRGDGEEIRNFLHRNERTVDEKRPDDMKGLVECGWPAERTAQRRRRRQRYIDDTTKELRPSYLQRKAQKHLMENLYAT